MITIPTDSDGFGRFYLHTSRNALGIEEQSMMDDLKIIPLPFQEIIRVRGTVDLPAQAFLYDLNGRMITSMTLHNQAENEIPVKNLNDGIYMFIIQSQKTTIKRKISWTNN
jgi:hypothetical protein